MWWHWSPSSHKMMPKYLFSRKKIYDSQFTAALWYEMMWDDVKLAHGKRDTRWLTEPFARSVYAFLNFSLPLENPNKLWISRWTFSSFIRSTSPRPWNIWRTRKIGTETWIDAQEAILNWAIVHIARFTHITFHYSVCAIQHGINLFICLFADDGTRSLRCLRSN